MKLKKTMAPPGDYVCWRMDLGDSTLTGVCRVSTEAEACTWVRSQPMLVNVTCSYSTMKVWDAIPA